MASDTRVVTAHLPLGLADKVDAMAARLERSRGWVVKQALAAWVDLEEERHRMTLDAMADVEAGRVVNWQQQDSAEVLEWAAARRVTLANLKPSRATISLRLPEAMLAELKLLANQQDVSYQSLLKIFLAERLDQERQRRQRVG